MGDAGFVIRPSQPIIGYLAREQALVEEEEKKQAPQPKREPTGFIGLEDDTDQAAVAFHGFLRKGLGGDSADDRGGAGFLPTKGREEQGIWAISGGLD